MLIPSYLSLLIGQTIKFVLLIFTCNRIAMHQSFSAFKQLEPVVFISAASIPDKNTLVSSENNFNRLFGKARKMSLTSQVAQ